MTTKEEPTTGVSAFDDDDDAEVKDTSLDTLENSSGTERAASPSWGDDDDDELDELGYQYLFTLQPSSEIAAKGEGRPGELRLSRLDDPLPQPLLVIPMFRRRERYLMSGKYGDDNRQTLCYSADARKGLGTPGGDCGVCELAKGACQFVMAYLVFNPIEEDVYQWTLRGSGLSAARDINTFRKKAGGLGKFAVEIATELRSGNGTHWYAPVVKRVPMPEGLTLPQLVMASADKGDEVEQNRAESGEKAAALAVATALSAPEAKPKK